MRVARVSSMLSSTNTEAMRALISLLRPRTAMPGTRPPSVAACDMELGSLNFWCAHSAPTVIMWARLPQRPRTLASPWAVSACSLAVLKWLLENSPSVPPASPSSMRVLRVLSYCSQACELPKS